MSTYYHLSKDILVPGTVLETRGYPFVSLDAEAALDNARPADCIARALSVYMCDTPQRTRLGVKYSGGHIHVVKPAVLIKRHDFMWVGELQRRHPAKVKSPPKQGSIDEKIAAKLKPDTSMAALSDEMIATNYWLGIASSLPHWEVVSTSALLIGLAPQ